MARQTPGRRLKAVATATLALTSGLLAASGVTAVLPASPSAAAEDRDELLVRITRLSPTVLVRSGTVTVGGVVRNPASHAWADAKVYVAVRKEPLSTRGPVQAALSSPTAEVGPRVVEASAVARLGTVRPGQSKRFSITVSPAQLGLSGADGVYPLGVQVLAARPADPGTTVVAGGAATVLPFQKAQPARPAPTTVLWPFLLRGDRRSDGSYAELSSLVRSIGPGGQMRNLLDLALTTPRRGSDVVIDPSLFSVVDDIARQPGKSAAVAAQRRTAVTFLDDLTRLAERYSCAAIGYDSPDLLALMSSPFAKELTEVVARATVGTLRARDLDCLRIEWPSARGVDRTALTALRRQNVAAVIVSPWAVPDWDGTHGNLLERKSPAGVLPLLVNDRLGDGAAGVPTTVTVRQAILSEALLTSLTSGAGLADTSTVVLVDPGFNPGRVSGEPLAAVYDSGVTEPVNLAARVRSHRTPYLGGVPDEADVKPISSRLTTVAADAAQTERVLDGVLLYNVDRTKHAQIVARLISQRWRGHSSTGLDAADHAIAELSGELAAISVDGPAALALSGGSGQFPVTVKNRTPHRVRVALGIDSSAPGVRFTGPPRVEVSPGESRTVTIHVDLNAQTATTVSVRLSSAQGLPFGAATVFNVRSTRVGAALWIAIGVSVAFVAVALVRRFARPGHRPTHPSLPPDDFDD